MTTPASTVADIVRVLRTAPVIGHVVDLVPYGPAYHERLIVLRNTDRASYYLHQPAPLVLEGQAKWFAGYEARFDDIQWVIVNKQGAMVGGTALYGITDDRSRAEKGRLVVDEARAKEAPYILEAELLLLDVAFDRLQVARVDTCVRDDNAVMQSINAKLGFERTGEHDIRGVEYFDYALTPARYAPDRLRATARAWAARSTRLPQPVSA